MAEEKKKGSLTKEVKSMLDDAIDESVDNIESEFIETCNIGFDLALTNGKGIPMGTSILFYAEPGCGKTTLLGDVCLRLIDSAKKKGEDFKVLYIATEDSKELLKSIGLAQAMEEKTFLYVKKEWCWRDVEGFYEGVLQEYGMYKGVKLIVIDSVNNVLSDANKSKSVADGDYGSRAKERTMFYSKYLPRCSEKGISSFFIAQVRQDQEAGQFQDHKKAAATWADFHNVEMVVKCTRKSNDQDGQKIDINTVFGSVQQRTKYVMKLDSAATSCKNRFFLGMPAEVLVVRGKGIDNTYTARKLLEGNGYVKKNGGWYTFDKTLQELFDVSDSKMRLAECNKYIRDNLEKVVELLKNADQYKIELSTEIIEDDSSDGDE